MNDDKIKDYTRQLQQIFHGGNWLAESFEGKLKGLTDSEIFTQPVEGVHSVAELVWHCTYWRNVTIKRMEGNTRYRDETIEKLNFIPLPELKSMGWAEIFRQLRETQSGLLKLLDGEDDSFLMNEYQPGYSFGFLIEGTIHHDAYHLGQIGLVLKILKTKKPDRG